MLVDKEHITQYIPQRAPMVMVHQVLEASDVYAVTSLEIEPENIFVKDGYLTEPGLIENIAQTAAAQVGYVCALINKPVPIGYIASVKDLKIFALPQQKTTITTTVKVANRVMDVTIVHGQVKQGDEILCTCEMRIFVKPD